MIARTRTALVLVLTALLVAAGCGVPDESEPVEVGAAPGFGGPAGRTDNVRLPAPGDANTASRLVELFLQAGAAADWDPALPKDRRMPEAQNHARRFLTPDAARNWRPGRDRVLVVDPGEFTFGIGTVEVPLRPVGVLDDTGVLSPLDGPEPEFRWTFRTSPAGPAGSLLLDGAPQDQGVLLSLEGLAALFEVRPVYFWDKSDRYLVPDRRYLSKGISTEKRIKEIVDRLLAGPSNFLKNVVDEVPAKATLDNPELHGDRVDVNLPAGALSADQNERRGHITSQIRWSLHPNLYTVELQIAGRPSHTDSGNDYLRDNPSEPEPGAGTPDDERLYGVVDGRVVRVLPGAGRPAILEAAENSTVVSAAVNRASNTAALVRRQDNQVELWLGRYIADQGTPLFVRANLPPAASMSRPSYLPGSGGRVLVAAGGALYDVAPDGTAQPVQLGTLGAVTAVSVAPDGARVALITARSDGEHAWVATLDTSGPSPAVVGSTRALYLPGLTQLRGVGWLYEHQLVVGGAAGLYEVAIDDGYVAEITPSDLGGAQLTQVSAVPWNPKEGRRGNVVVEAAGQAYYPYKLGLTPIDAPTPAPSGSPSAGASTGTGTAPTVPKLSAPFYIDTR